MKKSIFTALVCIILGSTASAQFGIGAGLVYGTESELGYTLRFSYDVNENITGVVGLSILESTSIEIFGVEISSTVSSFDLDGHYNFGGETIKPYALAGLNMLRVSAEADGMSESDSNLGFNLGAGALYGINENFAILGEAKYTINGGGEGEGDANQAVITGGVQYTF